MARQGGKVFQRMFRRLSPTFRERGKILRQFSENIGLVHFGTVHQHSDEYDAIRGFTASITHQDTHYAVGTYNGFNIRLVNRFDIIRIAGQQPREQVWTILEVELDARNVPHMFFMPTGREAGEYGRFYNIRPNMQLLNSMVLRNRSPEFHGRYQILARTTNAHRVETLFTSPLIVGIASRFWPHGIEIERGKLLIYITEHRLSKAVLETTLTSALWLTETIEEISHE